jgi:FkbM family methyltransferase
MPSQYSHPPLNLLSLPALFEENRFNAQTSATNMTFRLSTLFKSLLPSGLVHQIKQRRLKRAIAAFPPKTVKHQYGLFPLSVRITDPIASAWYDQDYSELPEVAFLKNTRLKPGASIFDLGAHQGVVAMMLAREVAPGGNVIAVEGTRHNAEIARQNLELNGIENVTLIHAIVGDVAGKEVVFSNTLNGSVSANGVGETVKTVTIDSLAKEHGIPDIVFLDIEGFEGHALVGASQVLSSGADFCIEVHENCGLQDHGTKEQIMAFFPTATHQCFISFPEGSAFQLWTPAVKLPLDRFWLIAQPINATFLCGIEPA